MNELLWFVSRATGVAAVTLLTVVMVLGMVTASRRPHRGMRAAVVFGLHRSLSLGASVFLLVHIATAVVETYVNIDLISAVVPFTAGYEPFWVGLGTIAFDIAVAVMVTSLLRHRLPERVWRAVHWLAYAFWPIAVIHGLVMGTGDEPILRFITIACGAVGVVAVGYRYLAVDPHAEKRYDIASQEWT
jgi:predicted ferric reductase